MGYKILGAGIGAGYDIKLTEHVFMEPMVRYIANTLNADESNNQDLHQNSFYFNLGIMLRL